MSIGLNGLLINFRFDRNMELLIPYEYSQGIISVETMKEIANNLLELAETLTNEEIDQINNRHRNEQVDILERERQEFLNQPKSRKLRSGVVYLIKAKDTNRYKIGCTTNLKSRLKSLSIKNPYELELIHSIPSNDIEEFEKALHEQFKAFRTHSEWFELPVEAVQEFCNYQPQ